MKRYSTAIQMFSVLLFCATPWAATAAPALTAANIEKKVKALVARDLDSLFTASYDAGQGCAEVAAANCRIRPHGSKGFLGFCTADIEVQPSRASMYKKTVTCISLRYNVAPDLTSAELVYGEEDCVELVNGVSEY